MSRQRALVLGTHNQKKLDELLDLLPAGAFQLFTLDAFPHARQVVEDGQTFSDNAGLKAAVQAKHLGHWVLAEDSGLAVDALEGAPGVYSARYAGEDASDAANNQRLLEQLGDLPLAKRTAHYVCHVALSNPAGEIDGRCEEVCRGRILFELRGSAGFGYDPLFEIEEYHRTFAELGLAVKSVLSHRSRAMRRMVPQLLEKVSLFNAEPEGGGDTLV